MAFLLVACGHARPRLAPGDTAIGSLAVRGNHAIESEVLLDGLMLHHLADEGEPFDPSVVKADTDRLRGVYYRKGFFAVQVTADIKKTPARVDVTFVVTEGKRARLKGMEVNGLPEDMSPAAFRKIIPLGDGAPFDYEPYDKNKVGLTDALRDAGYAHAVVDTQVAADAVKSEAVIVVDIVAGAPAYFGPVTLEGADGELADAVLRRVKIVEGDRYSQKAMAQSQADIYRLGRFAQVHIEPDLKTDPARIPVRITLTMGTRHELKLGGGFGLDPTAYEVRGRAAYRVTGWPTPLTDTSTELRVAELYRRDNGNLEPRIEVLSGLERTDLFGWTYLTGEAQADLSYLTTEAYTTVGPRFRLGLKRPIYKKYVAASIGWQIRVLDFINLSSAISPDKAVELDLDWPYVLAYYDQRIFVDLRDDPVEPRRGGYLEVRAEEGGAYAGGQFDYMLVQPDLRGFLPLPWKIVLAGRLRVGLIFGELPVTQRFFAGGASSQRGFPERRLAPVVSNTVTDDMGNPVTVRVPIGGGGIIETGLELRVPIGHWGLDWGFVAFLDGGDVTEDWHDLDPGFLHWAAGGGLRAATPIGAARLDVGYRLNRTGPGEPQAGDHWAFHFSLGEAF